MAHAQTRLDHYKTPYSQSRYFKAPQAQQVLQVVAGARSWQQLVGSAWALAHPERNHKLADRIAGK
jgi:hypothetical protein